MTRFLPTCIAGIFVTSQGAAQHDPKVPTPRAVLGYDVGDRFTPHHTLVRYLERVAAASPRVRLDTVVNSRTSRIPCH